MDFDKGQKVEGRRTGIIKNSTILYQIAMVQIFQIQNIEG